jgi:acyl dehydratase
MDFKLETRNSLEEAMSKFYDDYRLEETLATRGRTVTEADVVAFAGLSGDFIELHTNEEYARHSPFGRRIAHGALVFSISTGLVAQMGQIHDSVIAFYGIDKLRFTKPVFIGDTVTVKKRVVELTPKDETRGVVAFETTVLNQSGEAVMVYTDRVLLRRRPE